MRWQLQHAKARLSELIRRARSEGPQIITVHGKEEFVLIKREELEARIAAGVAEERSGWEGATEPKTGLDIFRRVLGLGVDLMDYIPPREVEPEGPPLFEGPDWEHLDEPLAEPKKP
jgi:prevent-host-death family protein